MLSYNEIKLPNKQNKYKMSKSRLISKYESISMASRHFIEKDG